MGRRTLALITILLLAGCGGGEAEPPGERSGTATEHVDRADAVAIELPAGWRAAKRPLTSVIDPREVLSAATLELPPRGDGCSHMPEAAVAALGPDDALVTIFERARFDPGGYPPRPARLRFEADNGIACVSRPGVRASWISFRDQGRAFYALVALGSRASQREAVAVLNSFRPTSPETVAHLREGCQPVHVQGLLEGFLGAINRDDSEGALRYVATNPELIGFFVSSGRGADAETVEARTPAAAYQALARIRGGDRFTVLGAAVGAVAPLAYDDRYPELDGPRAGVDFILGLGSRTASGKAGINCASRRIYVMPVSVVRGLHQPGQRVCGRTVAIGAREPAVCAYPP